MKHGTFDHAAVRGIPGVAARWAVGFALALSLALLASCGRTPTGGGPGTTAGGTTATGGATSGATSGPVTLAPGQAQYGVGDTIVVTVHNGLGGTIYALAEHTDCSAVLLERQVNGSWQGQGDCAIGQAKPGGQSGAQPRPMVVQIASGATQQVQMPPAASASADNGADNGVGSATQWPVGTYRAALTYATGANQPIARGTVAYSATFTVA